MTDEQWLNAISDYDDTGSRFERTGELIGGASQLSQLLEKQVQKEPTRFAQLIWQFPDNWTDEAIDMVVDYALNDPNPEQQFRMTGDILTDGINSTRGSAVVAIAKLIFADKNRVAYLQGALEQIVKDSSIAVRTWVAEALIAVLNYDRDMAIGLFKELIKTEDILLGTYSVENFLYYALRTHFQQLAPILEKMINSQLPTVQEVGARQACLISLSLEQASPLVQSCLSGTATHRKAAAQVYSANLRLADWREVCENALLKLFSDPDENVRSQAAN
jgi:hypothetical protein